MTSGGTGDGLPPLRKVIAKYGLSARKALGQCFLLDLNLTRRIARAGGPLEGATVYEVGPGPGGLTRALLAEGAARVIAVERDARCLTALEEIAAAFPGRLKVVSGDAMAIDEQRLFRETDRIRVVANLPYNVGTALLVKWLTVPEWPPFWQSLTLMFQREVAERLTAEPGTHAYGRLSVLTQWRATAKILFEVSPRAFTPPPKVTSSVVRTELRDAPLAPARLGDLERIAAAAFGQRRKMLRQSLRRVTGDAEALLAQAGVEPTARPETLTIAQFCALARALARGS